ncbi:MAG: YceI family protein [Saprospiraceae bacterium]
MNNLRILLILTYVFSIIQCKMDPKKKNEIVTQSNENYGTLFEMNADQSIIYWIGTAALKSHNGSLRFKSGNLEIDQQGQLKGGNFHVDMKSIANLDISDAQGKKDLEEHLKSVDFLAVDTFPEADFIIQKVIPITDSISNNLVVGDMTIRGITNEVQLKANVIYSGNSAMIVIPEFTIDRTRWNINYQSSKIINIIKDKLINDEIKLSIKIIAVRK